MSKPHPTELVPDAAFEALVRSICRRPGMYVQEPYFESVSAYLQGYDAANFGGPLLGFHQLLVLEGGGADNIGWPGNVRRLIGASHGPLSDEVAVAKLGEVILDFIAYRRANGLTKIFYDYGKCLLRKSSYSGPLRSSPASRSTRARAKSASS